MVDHDDFFPRSPDGRRNFASTPRDTLIDIDGNGDGEPNSAPPSPRLRPDGMARHRTMTLTAEDDVCFPADEASEFADDDFERSRSAGQRPRTPRRRRRHREWPQLWVLDEWSRVEKEDRAGERRAKKISEPVFVDGRLRPAKRAWHRAEDDVQYRYTYFNELFESTIHSQTISELIQPEGSFRELFIPDPPELTDSSSSEDEAVPDIIQNPEPFSGVVSPKSQLGNDAHTTVSSLSEGVKANGKSSSERDSGSATPQTKPAPPQQKEVKYGPRPTFWLDVVSPTEQEMKVLTKAFGIHPLTSEDIMMQEAREKVELFRNYYFINYRTFEQDTQSEDYLEPINMYVCVFRHGIITFHFSQIPHPANVRRRIRQLSDYLILTADWISYAIIDDITDVYQPLITSIEEEVDVIDDLILKAFQQTSELGGELKVRSDKDSDTSEPEIGGFDMLLRIGECRKKVMSLYRLLGNKADVIKGFAKRCNEQWEVAPRSEIGLYLGDIQDHILTMTGNLGHYETLLSRAHGNYLAQVSINMNERQEKVSMIVFPMRMVFANS
jgi:magnesium transporter